MKLWLMLKKKCYASEKKDRRRCKDSISAQDIDDVWSTDNSLKTPIQEDGECRY